MIHLLEAPDYSLTSIKEAMCNVAVCEPAGFKEVIMDQKWMAAMQEELFMIEKNQT